ncbi:MAG TPA: hypothetical protein VFL95_07185 [Gemmatimonadales bacterium]|nr:hypothetical protein [Gemmatimonadales bacterium]
MFRRNGRRRKLLVLTLLAGMPLVASCTSDSTDLGVTSTLLMGVYAGSDGAGSLLVNLAGAEAAGTLTNEDGDTQPISGTITGSDLKLTAGSFAFTGLPTSGAYANGSDFGEYLLRSRSVGSTRFALCASYSGTDFSNNQPETGHFAVLFTSLGPTGVLFQDNIQNNSNVVATSTASGFAIQAKVSQTSVFGASGTISADSSTASGTFTRGSASGNWTATRCL